MNNSQRLALVALEKAFARCRKANLSFAGMDGDLLVFDSFELKVITDDHSLCDEQYAKNPNQGKCVNTSGTYYDSGGW